MNGGWNYVLFSMGIVFGAVTTVSDGLSIETNIQCLTGDIDIYIYIYLKTCIDSGDSGDCLRFNRYIYKWRHRYRCLNPYIFDQSDE